MADPVTIGLVAMGVGTAIGAMGAIRQGQAAEAAADYNAKLSEQNADLSMQQAAFDEKRLRVAARKQIGSMRANYAASGVQLEGSALDVLQESAASAEYDALVTRAGGVARANQFNNEASLERFSGANAVENSRLMAASSILVGGGQMATRLKRT